MAEFRLSSTRAVTTHPRTSGLLDPDKGLVTERWCVPPTLPVDSVSGVLLVSSGPQVGRVLSFWGIFFFLDFLLYLGLEIYLRNNKRVLQYFQ